MLNQLTQWSYQACLELGTDWSWPLQCCYGNEMRLCDKQTLITFCCSASNSANCLFSVSWPACPNFLFRSVSRSISQLFVLSFLQLFFLAPSLPVISSYSHPLSVSQLDPHTVNDDVTLSSKLTVRWKLLVWVKSPLTEIREHCLLGPALLQLLHRHSWRALLHGSVAFCTVWMRTVTENCMRHGQNLELMIVILNKHMRDVENETLLWYSEALHCWFTVCIRWLWKIQILPK